MSERARGDPEVIRAEQLSTTPEVSGQSTIGQSRFFVDGQEDVEISLGLPSFSDRNREWDQSPIALALVTPQILTLVALTRLR